VQQKLIGEEPYDKQAAKETINLFLKNRTGNPAFLKKLKMKMAEEGALQPAKPASPPSHKKD
jgi:DNA-binding SARP family transcriptional activator